MAVVSNPRTSVFKDAPTDISTEAIRYMKVAPESVGITPLRIKLSPQGEFIDLSRSYFEFKVRLRKTDGTAPAATAAAGQRVMGPENNFAHTMIKQLTTRLNGTLMTSQDELYAYKSYLKNILYHTPEDGNSILQPQGWTSNVVDVADVDLTANRLDETNAGHTGLTSNHQSYIKALKKRQNDWRTKEMTFIVYPNEAIFEQGKLLSPGVEIQNEIHFNSAEFMYTCMTDAARFTENDIKVNFVVALISLNPDVFRTLMATQAKTPMRYPITATRIRRYPVAQNETELEITEPFNGRIPQRVLIVAIPTEVFNGDALRSPFIFSKAGITQCDQFINGEMGPYPQLDLTADNSRDLLGYRRFLEATGCLERGQSNIITYDQWGQGKNATIFAFNNVASGITEPKGVVNPELRGHLRYLIKFPQLAVNHMFLVYGEFESKFTIDVNKTVFFDSP